MSFSTSTPNTKGLRGLMATVTVMVLMLLSGTLNAQTFFSENFETDGPGWTVINAGSGNNWTISTSTSSPDQLPGSTKYLNYRWNTSNAANTWAFSPGIALTGGTTYGLEFYASDAGFTESFKVTIGSSATVAGQTTTLLDFPAYKTAPMTRQFVNFTVPSTGTYYLSFNCYSIADQFSLSIDNIRIFIPQTADAAPTTFSTSAVTTTGMTVNWVDNSTNETGFKVFRSTDNVTFVQIGAIVPSTTTAGTGTAYSSIQTGLAPGVTYYYKVVSSADADSPPLLGTGTTLPPGNITSVASGSWKTASTWSSGTVPTLTDNVTILDGHTITIDSTANALSVTVGSGSGAAAILQNANATARTLNVNGNVVINSNGTIKSGASGSITNTLSIAGDLTINGTGTFNGLASTTNKLNITFVGATNNTFTTSATSSTTFNVVTINKPAQGTVKSVLNFNPGVAYIAAASTGFSLTAGILEISGTTTISDKVFSSTSYSILTAAGFWLNNPNFTVVGQVGSPSNTGLLRISTGIFNIGTLATHTMSGSTGEYVIEGGVLNITGKLTCSGAGKYTQSGGIVNVSTVGNATSSAAGLDFSSTTSSINISGGVINLVQASTGTTPIDIRFAAAIANITYTGGVINVGTANTVGRFNFRLSGNLPAIQVNSNDTASLYISSGYNILAKNVTINAGGTLDMNGYFNVFTGNVINNGVLMGDKAGSRFYFGGTTPQVYSGSGTVKTGFLSLEVDNPTGLTLSSDNQIGTARIILFTGGITNSNKITLGFGAATSATVQIGNTTTPTDAGFLDQAPTFNIGTGGQTLSYLRTTNPRSTGNEINPSRNINNFLLDDNLNNLTLAGGSINVSGILTLTNGQLITGSNTVNVLGTTVGSVVRTNGYINGSISRVLPASLDGSVDYLFPVGKSTYNPFELVQPHTLAIGTVTVKAEVFDGNSGGTPGNLIGAISPNRYWAASITDGAADFNNTNIRLYDTRGSYDVIGASATKTGAYDIVGTFPATLTDNTITSNYLTPTETIPGYFVMANASSPVISNVVITPNGNQCTNVARNITATVTPGGAAVNNVSIHYEVDGGAEIIISMTNTGGNNWSGTIPAVTPSYGKVTWRIVATDANSLDRTFVGSPYSDEALRLVTITGKATPTAICAGEPIKLNNVFANLPNNTIGSGTSTSSSSSISPVYSTYGGAKTQYIFKGSELSAAGFTAGNLTSLSLDISSGSTTAIQGFAISIGTTSQNAAITNSAINSGLVQVYSNAAEILSTGVRKFNFSSPFMWDGFSNIVVSFCYSQNATSSPSISVRYSDAGFTSSLAIFSDSRTPAVICNATSTTNLPTGGAASNSTSTSRPNMLFGGNTIKPLSYSWSNGTSVVGTQDTITVNPTVPTTYTSTVTFSNGCNVISSAVTPTVNALPTAPTVLLQSTQCGLGTPQVMVDGAGTGSSYRWYLTSTGGSPLADQSANTLSNYPITQTTTFYVSIHNGTCESERTAVVATVNVPDAIVVTASQPNTCANSAFNLTATNQGTTQNYSYTWSATPSTGSGLTGSETGSTVSVTPTSGGTYVYTAVGVDGSCTTTANLTYTITAQPVLSVTSSATGAVCAGTPVNLTALSKTSGPVTGTVGVGGTTTNGTGSPFYRSYGGYKSQYIFTKAELNAAGLSAGNITSLSLETVAAPSAVYNFFAIGMANTSESGFASTSSSALPTTNVFNGSLANNGYTPTVGVNTFVFSTPFTWDGTSNVVVSICYSNNNGGDYSNSATVKTDSYPNASLIIYDDNQPASLLCAATGPDDGITGYAAIPDARPKMSFAGIGDTYGVGNLNYVWTPGNISGNAITVTPASTTTYTVTGTSPTTGCGTSSTIDVNVNPLPSGVTGTIPSTQCGVGVPTDIFATGGLPGMYRWYLTPTGGTAIPGETNASLSTYVINTTTTFYVAITNGTCESGRTSIVATVNIPDAVSVNLPATGCVNSEIAISAVQTGTTQNYTYTWTATPEAGSGISGSVTGQTINITPTAAGNYTYKVTAVDGGCTTLASGSLTVNSLPIVNTVANPATPVCFGSTVNLTATTNDYAPAAVTYGAGALTTTTSGGSSGNNVSPFSHYYGGFKTQYIIPLSELTASGLVAGNITSLSFNVTTAGTTYNGFALSLASTSATSLTSTFVNSGFTSVYSGNLAVTATGTKTITFSTPFNWNGTSGIVVQLCWSNNNSGGTAAEVKYDNTSYVSTSYYRVDSETPSFVCSATTATGTVSSRPQMVLQGIAGSQGPGSLNWSWNPGNLSGNSVSVTPSETTTYTATGTNPVTGCSNTANVQVVINQLPDAPIGADATHCGTRVSEANVMSGGANGSGIFNWYTTETGGTPVQSSTSLTYLEPIGVTTTFYVSENGTSGCESIRVPVTTSVIDADLISLSATPVTNYCENQEVVLEVTQDVVNGNGYEFTYTATPEAGSGITGSESGQVVSIFPTTAGTYEYTVSGYDERGGCSALATATITINPPPVITSVTATPSTICAGVSTTLKAENIQASVQNVTVGAGAGTASGTGSPFYGLWGGHKNQYIFTASELQALGVIAGDITSLSLDVTDVPAGVYKGFAIGIASTTQSEFASIAFLPTTTVYTGSLANNGYVPTVGINTFNFSAPFHWDGTSNIVVSFCFSNNDSGGSAGDATVKTDTYSANYTVTIRADNVTAAAICAATNTTDGLSASGTTSGVRPQFRFNGLVGVNNTNQATYSWSPGGLTGSSVSVTPAETTTYTVTATNSNGCTADANVVVTVIPLPEAPVASNSVQCGYGIPTASVSGTGTFLWYDAATGGNLIQTGGSTYADEITETTTFYVSATDGTCEGPRSMVVATVNQPDAITATAAITKICEGGGTTLGVTQTGTTQNYTYTWTATPSAGSGLIDGATGATQNINPTAFGTYTYNVIGFDSNGGCNATSSITVTYYANPLITSVTATPSTTCAGAPVTLKAKYVAVGNGDAASIGSGTTLTGTTDELSAFNNRRASLWSQAVFTKAELNAAGLYGGNITGITYNVTSIGSGATNPNYTVRLASTSANAFTTFVTTGFTTVYGPATYTHDIGLNKINFTTPYNWDGESNIIVDVYQQGVDLSSNAQTYYTATTLNTSIYSFNTSVATSGSPTGTLSKNRLNVIFSGVAGVDYTNLSTYVWTPGGATGATITVNPATTTTYSVVATNSTSGCVSTPASVTVNVIPVAAAATASPAVVCAGFASSLNANATGGAPFTYSWSDGASVVGTTAVISVSPTTTTTYTVTVKDACGVETTSQVTLMVNPLPTVNIVEAAAITLCSPATQTYTVITDAANPTYQWNLGGVAISGATNSSYTASASGSYTVTVTNGTTSCVKTSAPAVLTVNPLPTPVVLTPSEITICEGSSTILNASSNVIGTGTVGTGTVSNIVTTPYKGNWGGSKTQILFTKADLTALGMVAGSNINSIGMNITAFTGPYTFNGFRIGMKNTSSSSLTSTFETGTTTVLGPVNYTLNVPGVPFVVNHTLTTPFVWNGSSNVLVEYCFNNQNSGGGSATSANVASTTITGRTSYGSIDSSPNVCTATSATPSTTRPNVYFGFSTASPITWSPSAGLSATTGNTVTANPITTTTYTAKATNAFGCTTSSSVTVSVTPALAVGAAISGPTNACAYMGNGSQLAVYSVTATNAGTYTWTIPAGALNVTGQGTNTISFNYPMSFTSGDVSVSVAPMAPCSTSVVRTLSISRTVPAAPVVSGIVNVCNYVGTGVELTYTAAPDPNVTSYVWTVGPEVTIVSGQGTNSINITLAPGFANSPGSKQIRVTSMAACGSSQLAIFYLAAQLPITPGFISGPTELCSYVGTSTQATYSISDVTAALSYIWSVPTGATIVGNSTGTSINVVYDNSFTGGYVTVRAVNSCGTSGVRSFPVKRTTPSMPGLISGPRNICLLLPSVANPNGLTGVYSVSRIQDVTYVWTVPEGIVIESHNSTATEDAITVSYNSNYSGGSISVHAVGVCGTSAERVLTLSQLTPGSVGGILQLSAGSCEDRTYTYGVSSMPSNATSLEWTVPESATIISGQGTTTITVVYTNAALAGEITATGNNGCGNSSTARTFQVKLGGCTPPEPMVKVDPASTPKVELASETLDVKVYPNPSVTTFRLKATSSNLNELIHVRIVDNLGREHKRLQMRSGETISFGSELKAGSYFVEVIQGKQKTVKKVLKF